MAKSLDNLVSRAYDISIAGSDAGYANKIKVAIELVRDDITVDQLYKQVLGHRIQGAKVSVSAELIEANAAALALAFPWKTGTGSKPIMPASLGVDDYAWAVPVVLHPRDMGADLSLDIHLTHAVFSGKLDLEGGSSEQAIPITFEALPDRTKLPVFDLGYIGATAPV